MTKPPGRPRLSGDGRKAKSSSRTCKSAREKLEILKFLESCGMPATLDRLYSNLNAKGRKSKATVIYGWRANQALLEARLNDPKLADLRYIRPTGIATVLSQTAELDIVAWINILRKDGVPVSRTMLKYKPLEVAREIGVSSFSASWHWEKGFLRRHRMSLRCRTRQGQIAPADADQIAAAFGEHVRAKMLSLGISTVFNADQTGVFFEYLPKQSISARGAKTVWVRHGGKDKERVTVMLLASSDGVKSTPFVVFKSTRSKIPGGMHAVHANEEKEHLGGEGT